jgi:hypothetical protein
MATTTPSLIAFFPLTFLPTPLTLLQKGFARKLLTGWDSSDFPHKTNS